MNHVSGIKRIIGRTLTVATLMTLFSSIGLNHISAQKSEQTTIKSNVSQSGSGITVNPTVEILDGVIRGSFQGTSTSGRAVTFKFLSSSAGGKMSIGNVPTVDSSTDPQSFTVLPYATWLDGGAKGIETFTVLASPAAGKGLTVKQSVKKSLKFTVVVNVGALAPGDTPVAMTYKVVSFDGKRISTNFFPASGLPAGGTSATLLNVPELGMPGEINPYVKQGNSKVVPGPAVIRSATSVGDVAYNMVTWDPRGTYGSEGRSQFGTAYQEGRDASAIISWVASETPAMLNGPNDPALGIFGSGFGGNIALIAGATDPRTDAIVPTASWFTMDSALHQNGIFNSPAASSLLARLMSTGSKVNLKVASGISRGSTSGKLSSSVRSSLATAGVSINTNQMQTPTFFIQGTENAVSSLSEMATIAQQILANPYGVPVKSAWIDLSQISDSAAASLVNYSKSWFNKYVSGVPIPDAFTPNFQWWDQIGTRHTSQLQPFEAQFNSVSPSIGSSSGGKLGTSNVKDKAVKKKIKLSLFLSSGVSVAGAPTVSFTYKGSGSAKAVFVRFVEKQTGRIVGPSTTPVPVTLDRRTHTVAIQLPEIVWSVGVGSDAQLGVELLSSSKTYPRIGNGVVSISNIQVQVPTVAP